MDTYLYPIDFLTVPQLLKSPQRKRKLRKEKKEDEIPRVTPPVEEGKLSNPVVDGEENRGNALPKILYLSPPKNKKNIQNDRKDSREKVQKADEFSAIFDGPNREYVFVDGEKYKGNPHKVTIESNYQVDGGGKDEDCGNGGLEEIKIEQKPIPKEDISKVGANSILSIPKNPETKRDQGRVSKSENDFMQGKSEMKKGLGDLEVQVRSEKRE